MATDYRVEVLRDVPGLAGIPDESLAQLARAFEVMEVTDRFLCQEGSPAEHLFVLAEGQAEVIKASPDTRKYKVATLNAGVLFGQVGVVGVGRRSASVRAAGTVKVLRMDAARARELLRSDDFEVASPFRRALIVSLARQLRSATATTMRLALNAGLTEPATPGAAGPGAEHTPTGASEMIRSARGHLG
jgi:CRP-like cAMP-binding protein